MNVSCLLAFTVVDDLDNECKLFTAVVDDLYNDCFQYSFH